MGRILDAIKGGIGGFFDGLLAPKSKKSGDSEVDWDKCTCRTLGNGAVILCPKCEVESKKYD
jgi:hypothetical protein